MRKDFGIRRYVEIKSIGTAPWLAQLGERGSAEREVTG